MAKGGWLQKLGRGLESVVNSGIEAVQAAELAQAKQGKLYDGLTLQQWERRWENIGTLDDEKWRGVKEIGIYRVGRNYYIGRAIEQGRGLHKRLQQYHSGKGAGGGTASAQMIHMTAPLEPVSVLRMKTREAAEQLEAALIAKHKPEWNQLLK